MNPYELAETLLLQIMMKPRRQTFEVVKLFIRSDGFAESIIITNAARFTIKGWLLKAGMSYKSITKLAVNRWQIVFTPAPIGEELPNDDYAI